MKHVAKWLSLLLVAMLTVSGAAMAETAEPLGTIHRQHFGSDLTELPIVDEPLTIQVWKSFSSTVMESYEECEVFKEMEKRTGVHVDWVYPPIGSETDNFNLRCASNDLPHMFATPPEYKGGVEKAVDDGVYMAYTKYYEAGLTPNYKYLRDTYPKIAKDTVMDSGELIAWHMIDYVPSSPWSGLWVRQDKLQEAGLDVPVTIEDWDNMIRVFKDKFNMYLGVDMLSWYGVMTNYAFVGSYDTGYDWIAKNGDTAVYGPMEPGFKDFITLMNRWYSDGLLDPDFATINYEDYHAKMADGTYGAFTSAYGEIGQAIVSGMNNDPNYKLIAVRMPLSYEGQTTHLRQSDSIVRTDGDYLTARCEDEGIAETVVKWKDYWYSQEGGDLCSYGPEGVSHEWIDNGNGDEILKWTYEENNIIKKGSDMDFWTIYPLFKLHTFGYLRDSTAYDNRPEIWQCIDEWGKDGDDWFMPMIAETADETEEINRIMADINTYRDEMTFKFIAGQEPLENYDKFIDKLIDMGIEDATQLKQDALERYGER